MKSIFILKKNLLYMNRSIRFTWRNVLLILVFVFQIQLLSQTNDNKLESETTIPKEIQNKNVEQNEDSHQRYGFLYSRRKGGPNFFALYPSLTFQSQSLQIRSPIGSASMDHKNPLPVIPSIEIKSKSYHMGSHWGFIFHARSYEFEYNAQIVETQSIVSDSNESGSNSKNSASFSTKDLGSRIRGRYQHAFPAIYIGAKGEDRAKLGFGVGPSEAVISGTANFYNSVNPVIFQAQSLDRSTFLNRVALSQMILGADPSLDPLRTYFLANINEGKNLEHLGVYMAAKGEIGTPNFNVVTIAQIQYLNNTGNFTPLEILTLLSLNNGAYSNRLRSNATWVVFYEYPGEYFTFQLQVTSPLYYSGFNRFRFSFIDFSIQVPIEF